MTKMRYEAPSLSVINLENVRANNGNHNGWQSGFVAPGQEKKDNPDFEPGNGHGNGNGNGNGNGK